MYKLSTLKCLKTSLWKTKYCEELVAAIYCRTDDTDPSIIATTLLVGSFDFSSRSFFTSRWSSNATEEWSISDALESIG